MCALRLPVRTATRGVSGGLARRAKKCRCQCQWQPERSAAITTSTGSTVHTSTAVPHCRLPVAGRKAGLRLGWHAKSSSDVSNFGMPRQHRMVISLYANSGRRYGCGHLKSTIFFSEKKCQMYLLPEFLSDEKKLFVIRRVLMRRIL